MKQQPADDKSNVIKFQKQSPAINNEDRASAALAAVEVYRNVRDKSPIPTGDMWETISDLIGDLCHLAARHEIPPFEMLETGAKYYVNEIVYEENPMFLDVKATLDVLARRWPHDENGFNIGQESNEPYEAVNDESVAFWRAQIQVEYDLPPPPEER
jgi:hypothetical protein